MKMSNIVIGFSPESLAAINGLAEAMKKLAESRELLPVIDHGDFIEVVDPDEVPTVPVSEAKAEAIAPANETVTAPVPGDSDVPVVTESDVKKKVVQLAASGKKDEVRALVKEYADKVSDIPAEKLGEVWAKLEALEG